MFLGNGSRDRYSSNGGDDRRGIMTTTTTTTVMKRPSNPMVGSTMTSTNLVVPPKEHHRGILGFDVFELDATRRRRTEHDADVTHEEQNQNNNNNNHNTSNEHRSMNRNNNSPKDELLLWSSSSEFAHPGSTTAATTAAAAATTASVTSRRNSVQERFFPSPGVTWKHSPLSTSTLVSRISDTAATSNHRNNYGGASMITSKGWPSASLPSITTTTTTSATTSTTTTATGFLQESLPAWFPWIPTKSQIQSLKLNDLKEACSQRGLSKVRTHERPHCIESSGFAFVVVGVIPCV
jgi:hypothetical protein